MFDGSVVIFKQLSNVYFEYSSGKVERGEKISIKQRKIEIWYHFEDLSFKLKELRLSECNTFYPNIWSNTRVQNDMNM